MNDRVSFFFSRLRERLWVKPLVSCLLSISAAFLASAGDYYYPQANIMNVSSSSLETLLTIISASMLVMAVFAVGSMLSAYASVSSMATPRAFAIVITDDVSQYALSIFIGAFIFSIIGLIALMNGFYQETGRFIMFLLTIAVFIIVILGFVRWVDNIARLGSLGNTIAKVETVAAVALERNRQYPRLGGIKSLGHTDGIALYAQNVGYLQRIDMSKLQAIAESYQLIINVNAMVGTLVLPGEPLVFVLSDQDKSEDELPLKDIVNAFLIGQNRTFDEDPRFGLVVLSEIASRALSPAVNDPGTAIDIIGALVRLLYNWANVANQNEQSVVEFDRVAVPEIMLDDMFDDAFNAIARDGAGTIEVMLRLQKVYQSLATINLGFKQSADRHAKKALSYAEQELCLTEEFDLLKKKSVN
jgi:uncharacterized membrane protein